MKMIKSVVIAATTTLLFCLSLSTALAKEETKNIGTVVRVLKEVTAIQKNVIPPVLFKSAKAIAIFPGAAKTDFMISGKNAGGVLLVRDKDGKWSNPVFITLSGGTLGWQMVGEPMDIILLFKSKELSDTIIKDKLYLDFKVKMVTGPLGKTAKAAIKEDQNTEINSYVRSHGEFADVSVASSTVQIDKAANDAFYGKQKTDAADILSGKVENSSDDVKKLLKFLTEYTAGK